MNVVWRKKQQHGRTLNNPYGWGIVLGTGFLSVLPGSSKTIINPQLADEETEAQVCRTRDKESEMSRLLIYAHLTP